MTEEELTAALTSAYSNHNRLGAGLPVYRLFRVRTSDEIRQTPSPVEALELFNRAKANGEDPSLFVGYIPKWSLVGGAVRS